MKPHYASLLAGAAIAIPLLPIAAPGEEAAAAKIVAGAAQAFLESLDPAQRKAATFSWSDQDAREDWHFFPKERTGIYLSAMAAPQRKAALALLEATLSERGFSQAKDVMFLEQLLRDQGGDPDVRDPEKYAFAIYGDPATEAPWGWRVEGHHLSVNITVAGGEVASVTPSFFGTNPAEVGKGERKGLRVLGADEDAARSLARALVAGGFPGVVYTADTPREILTGADRTVRPLAATGVAAGKMPEAQKGALRQLVTHFTHRYRADVADAELAAIEAAGFGEVAFAWAGSLDPGEPHYFRIQGPTFLIEYVNFQGGANHAHAVWRDFEGDFGRDTLREHAREHH